MAPAEAPTARPAPRRRRRLLSITAAVCVVLVLVVFVGLPLRVGLALTHPERVPVTETPAAVGLAYDDIAFPSRVDHLTMRGWWIPSAGRAPGTVILAHGFGENRLIGGIGLPLAAALHQRGWNVLMFDFRASGQSAGTTVSIGEWETRDLLGAFDEARSETGGQGPIAFAGFSMGASTALLAAEEEPGVACVLADSPFARLSDYLHQNIQQWTHLPAPLNWVILRVVPLITGIHPARVDPLDHLGALAGRPVLLIGGADDQLIPPAQNAERLVAAAPPGTVTFWLAPGAGHIGAWRVDHATYLTHLDAWLAAFAGAPAVAGGAG